MKTTSKMSSSSWRTSSASASISSTHSSSPASRTFACWRANVRDAGLDEWVELIEADALDVLHELEDIFDVVFIDAEKSQYEHYFAHARQRVEPGGLVVADNVLSHKETLEPYSRARQSDPTLVSTTVPLDRGLELSVVLSESL